MTAEFYDVIAPDPCNAADRQYVHPDKKRTSFLKDKCGGCFVEVTTKSGQPEITGIQVRNLCWVPEEKRVKENYTIKLIP